MAPPKTYRNSSTNMTGWMVAKTSSWGVRAMRVRLRRAMTRASAKMAERGSLTGSIALSSSGCAGGRLGPAGMAVMRRSVQVGVRGVWS